MMDANLKNKKAPYLLSAILLAAVVFACAACAQSPSEEQNNINEETEQQETIEITLPGSPIQIFKIIKRRLKSTVLMSERMGTVLCWRLLRNREKLSSR